MDVFTRACFVLLGLLQVVFSLDRGLVILRFDDKRINDFIRSIANDKDHFHSHNGIIEALDTEPRTIEGASWPYGQALAMLSFETKEAAINWFNTSVDVKDPNWLGGVNAVLLGLRGFFTRHVEGFILSATKFDESHPRKQYTVIGRNTSLFGGVTEGSFPGTWEVIRGPRWFTTSTWLVVDTIHQMNQTNFDLQTGYPPAFQNYTIRAQDAYLFKRLHRSSATHASLMSGSLLLMLTFIQYICMS